MILARNGEVTLFGETEKILTDFTIVIRSIRDYLTEFAGAEISEEMIEKAFRISKYSEEELERRLRVEEAMYEQRASDRKAH